MLSLEVDEHKIWSVFQPIYSLVNQSFMGVEALVRGQNGQTSEMLPVKYCIHPYGGEEDLKHLKRLNKMHLRNWRAQQQRGWLFVNLDFQDLTKVDDLCLVELLEELGIPGKKVVVEVVESEVFDEKLLAQVVAQLREYGCIIALDDFGAGHSNIERISTVKPDIVKLDRKVLLNACDNELSESVLRNLVMLIKQSGSLSLLEGVETKAQAMLAMDVGVDLVQGFYFGRPERQCMNTVMGEGVIKDVVESYPAYRSQNLTKHLLKRKLYECMFKGFVGLESASVLEDEMLAVSSLSNVKRSYMLDMNGYQFADAVYAEGADQSKKVVKKGTGLCWRSRRYFVKAVNNPDSVYISRPYRSLIDVELCVTVSKVVQLQTDEKYVVCFDLHFKENS